MTTQTADPGTDLEVAAPPPDDPRDALPAAPDWDDVDEETFAAEIAEAHQQGEWLREIARRSPIRQIRYELGWRGNEWIGAAKELEQVGPDARIEMLMAVVPGMKVLYPNEHDSEWQRIVQVSRTGVMIAPNKGGYTKSEWLNYEGPTSPVMVRR